MTHVSQENGSKLINLPDDEPRVLQVLIHYVYHFTLDTTSRPVTSGLWTFLVHVYALADKYDLPPLRSLVVRRLHELCNPTTDIDQFIAVLRVVDACTAEDTLWDILVPKVSDHIGLLLKDQSFQELVMWSRPSGGAKAELEVSQWYGRVNNERWRNGLAEERGELLDLACKARRGSQALNTVSNYCSCVKPASAYGLAP